jgi:drug/metabolite transporter (DMT)-like permease
MSRSRAHVVLFIGLLLVSTSGPFIKSAHVDAYAVAFWRLGASGLLFGVYAWARGEQRFDRRHLRRMLLGSLLLATHVATWAKAFDLTDYASNLLLLVVQPVMAALAGIGLGERPTRSTWISVALATVGLGIITRGDFHLGPRALFGDALSVAGSGAMTMFYVVTRRARAELPLPTFMAVTMGAGAAAVLPVVLVSGARLSGYSGATWGWLTALVVITTLAGHGTMNFVARSIPLFTLNVVIVLEPLVSIVMGIPLFGASITALQLAGGAVLSVAVIVGLRPLRAAAAPMASLLE